ncbi:AAA family ATPase [Sulfurimonas sp. SAG-AH-194-C20]|nr:AAA family ATPase [Sulfurimonas sp. SAG-AH-194-C20]MDF1878110.1 AAA family ATPase [Sulfurimonas sp. SAG-AH-194-C20]
MQMHPDNLNGYKKEEILNLVMMGYIGIDIDSEYASKLGINDKPFTDWGETLQVYDKTHNSWDKQITSFLSLKKNDIVVVRHGEKFIALVKIVGDYQFNEIENIWFRHMYQIKILSTYNDFKEEYKIPKAQGTFEVSKTGETFKVINKIYKKTIKGKDMQEKINLLKDRNQIILQGPPGTGKTMVAKQMAISIIDSTLPLETNNEIKNSLKTIKKRVKLIQFHPSYSYEDFVRGIVADSSSKTITYKTENKVLAEMAKKALKDKNNDYILIIDEINRANLSSVLGELIYALEYRDEAVESMYALEDGSREITLPSNLYIIGTMNTADRSIGHIDYAIRRRFAFETILPNKDAINLKEGVKLFEAVEEIFIDTSPEFDKYDILLGHSYFIAKDTEELKNKVEYQIKPLLKEYVKDGVLIDTAELRAKINTL